TGDDCRLRPASDRTLAGTLRLCQAREPQRALYAPNRRCRPADRDRAGAAAYRGRGPAWPPTGHYMRQPPDADLLTEIERVLPHIAGGPELAAKLTSDVRRQLIAAMPG